MLHMARCGRMRSCICCLGAVVLCVWGGIVPALAQQPLTGPGITNVASGGYWDADLGVTFGDYVLLGDVIAQPAQRRTPNAIGAQKSGGPVGVISWAEAPDGLAAPFTVLRAQSTVPAGALLLPSGGVVVFMMNVTNWGNGDPGNVDANGFVLQGKLLSNGFPQFNPDASSAAGVNAPLVNAAPLLDPSDATTAYIFSSGLYRASPIYVARVAPASINAIDKYDWWTGSQWVNAASAAAPLALSNPLPAVGELTVAFDTASKRYILCYFDYTANLPNGPLFKCQSAPSPAGPWTNPVVLFANTPLPWYQSGWCCPYGGYFVTPLIDSSQNGGVVPFYISLWVPYRSFVGPLNILGAL